MEKKTDPTRKNTWGQYANVGMMFPTSIAVGLAIGYWLDRWLKTTPILLIIFTLYGVAAGFVNLLRMNRKKKP